MPPVAHLFAISFLLLGLPRSQLRRALGFCPILGIAWVPAECGEQARGAVNFVLIQNPDAPSILLLVFELVLDSLHIEIIGKNARARFVCKMADQSHSGHRLSSNPLPKTPNPPASLRPIIVGDDVR